MLPRISSIVWHPYSIRFGLPRESGDAYRYAERRNLQEHV